MANSEQNAEILRNALKNEASLTEKKMFGGLCFFINGNMLCGVDKTGGMFRVGKDNEPAALNLPGISPFTMTGRKMGGLVQANENLFTNQGQLTDILSLALSFAKSLPAKQPKPGK